MKFLSLLFIGCTHDPSRPYTYRPPENIFAFSMLHDDKSIPPAGRKSDL
jgi:hypothetical protein